MPITISYVDVVVGFRVKTAACPLAFALCSFRAKFQAFSKISKAAPRSLFRL